MNKDAIRLDPRLDPWERQTGETPKKHGQFVSYRDLGMTRTLTKAAENLALSYGHLRIVASQYRWRERVDAWDTHQAEQYTALLAEERRRAAESEIKILRVMRGMIGQALPTMRPDRMSWSEFTRFVDTTMRLSRSLFGDPTETIAITSSSDAVTNQLAEFAGLSPDDRARRLAALAAAVTRRVRAIGDDNEDDDEDQGDGQDQDGGEA